MPSALSVSKAYSISLSVASISSIDSGREQAEAARMVAHHFGGVIVAGAGEPAGFRRPDVEPQAGGGGERQHAGADAVLVHVLDQLGRGSRRPDRRSAAACARLRSQARASGIRADRNEGGYRSAQAWSVPAPQRSGPPRRGKRAEPRQEAASRRRRAATRTAGVKALRSPVCRIHLALPPWSEIAAPIASSSGTHRARSVRRRRSTKTGRRR